MKKMNMKKVLSLMLAGIALLANQSHSATFFADNFEASGDAGATGLSYPWEMNKQVFTSTGGYVGGYYPGSTFGPNAIVAGGAGNSYYSGKVYPDYGYSPDWVNGNQIKVNLLVAQPNLTSAAIAPGVIQMDFDFKRDAIPGANAKAYAFISLLSADWSATYFTHQIELGTFSDWSSGAVKITFNGTQQGLNLQYGFSVVDASYSGGAGLLIDNVTVSNVPEPSIVSLLGFGVAGLIATRLRRRS